MGRWDADRSESRARDPRLPRPNMTWGEREARSSKFYPGAFCNRDFATTIGMPMLLLQTTRRAHKQIDRMRVLPLIFFTLVKLLC